MGHPRIQCPAGEQLGEAGCRCRIERVNLYPDTDPRTLLSYCLGYYTACPTWRAHREAGWEDRQRALDREIAAAAGE